MPRVVYSERALRHVEAAVVFVAEQDLSAAQRAAGAIRSAVMMLAEHPYLGRRVDGEIRELIISFGRTGHVALYRVVDPSTEIRVLAVRHQREIDYAV